MSEIMIRRQVKRVMNYGIPKHMAKEIVEYVASVSDGSSVDCAVNYAVDLTYGLGLTQRNGT